jgi:HD-GYP domain-containing protein (c-di-GMP phosphodiesterase class II)
LGVRPGVGRVVLATFSINPETVSNSGILEQDAGHALPAEPRLSPRPWARLLERPEGRPVEPDESRKVRPYVLGIAFATAGALALVSVYAGSRPGDGGISSILFLVGLAITADLFGYQLSSSSSGGSIAVIPFVATALVAPNVLAPVAIAATAVVTQVILRRPLLKGVFNICQLTLSMSLSVLVYRQLGGPSFIGFEPSSLIVAIRQAMLPTLALCATLTLSNTFAVSGVVAIAKRQRFFAVWRAMTVATTPYFFLTSLFTFYLAWLYVKLGTVGALGLVIPMFGVRQLYKNAVELTNVTEELLDLMVAAIEARDPYTSGHSQRVARASKIIAGALGLSPAEVERVGVAALLHDVGKIDEAFAPILAKEGRLTPEEWALMKRHPVRSAELVGLLSTLRDIVAPVRHHHENWDGTGYPDGLKGTQIPLASRIIMFADTLDAMTTDRPYRKALGMEEAKAEFVKFKGRQFDPEICDRVVSAVVWEKLYASFADKGVPVRSAKAS